MPCSSRPPSRASTAPPIPSRSPSACSASRCRSRVSPSGCRASPRRSWSRAAGASSTRSTTSSVARAACASPTRASSCASPLASGTEGVELDWYPAPGKLNLFLHVLGRRPDGYHELQTVFRLIDRADRVGISARNDGEIRFSGPFGEENLCVRAARLLQSHSGSKLGCDLALEKNLPIGGGLGG